ncbi:ComEC/Rec2 family competence protein [Kordia jejudonensis]|uniref:hypothetical protein n=1 Tax=Kordia jejudonensis TaxID=1348245 RepID=UPI000629A398|nr:hypothetical protein [Kordia jejudonensis]
MKISAKFKFHPIGQGCFYTGLIPYDDKEFVMVYDCGSVSSGLYLEEAITTFDKEYNHIDLLVVSHLDQDHFNGIQKLLSTGISVDRIILPYLSLAERLALVATTKDTSEIFILFMMNPVVYLRTNNFEIKKISFIEGIQNDEENRLNDNFQNDSYFKNINYDDNDNDPIQGFKENQELRRTVAEKDSRLLGTNVEFLPYNTILQLETSTRERLWEFIFYYRKPKSLDDFERFQKAVSEYLKSMGIFTSYNLFDKRHLTALKKYYSKYLKISVNQSSICLYHGATRKARSWFPDEEMLMKISTSKLKLIYAIPRTGTMLTGDQEFRFENYFELFYSYFRSKIENVSVFQVPHHGSKKNWVFHGNTLYDHKIDFYVINHGFGRKHHPHKSVVDNLIDNIGKTIVLNNEYAEFPYSIL